jgi:D-xylonolactonase
MRGMSPAIRLVAEVKAVLGEGPVWVGRDASLYWVDIKGRRLFRLDDAGLSEWITPVRVGSIAPRAAGGFVTGTEDGFQLLEIDGEGLRFSLLGNPETDLPDNRFNDGKVDRAGRFWAGTMDDREKASLGSLYRLDAQQCVVKLDEGYAVTNGPAFSPAGDVMYHTDSARRTIYRFPLAPDGSLGSRETFLHFTGAEGYPDGMTVDAEACLWVAFWDGWAVRRFSPAGELLATIEVPVQRPTSVAFGGQSLDRLYITSARIGLDEPALSMQPSAGGLLMLKPGVVGIAERPFAG